jgi:hypothetical protein
LIKIILEAFPEAARRGLRREGGRLVLPLHMAIANGWPCHDLLLAAFPESAEWADPNTDLVPFQAAAASAMRQLHCLTEQHQLLEERHNGSASAYLDLGLNVAFELLRANPAAILRATPGGGEDTACGMDSSRLGTTNMERGSSQIEGMA